MTLKRIPVALTAALLAMHVAFVQAQAAKDPINDPTTEHQPQTGKNLRLTGSQASFSLTDAKGKELEVGELKWCSLRRNVGRFSEEEWCRFEGSRVVCDGLPGRGLEGGTYELSLGLGGYGSMSHSFELAPGKPHSATLKTETWRRIICVNLLDVDGAALPWVPDDPTYTSTEKSKPRPTPAEPARVLRDPPGTEPDGSGGFAYRRARGGGPSYRFNTDNGKFYARVFAGVTGTLAFTLGTDLFDEKAITLEDTFTDNSWENHEVRVSPTEAYARAAKQRTLLNAHNPGNKSLLTDAVNPVVNPTDEKTVPKEHWRVVMKGDAALALVPYVTVKNGEETVRGPLNDTLARAGMDFWLDVADECTIDVVWRSPNVIVHPSSIQRVKRSQRVVSVKPALNLIPFELDWPSDTAKACGAFVGVSISLCGTAMETAARSTDAPIKLFIDRAVLSDLTNEDALEAVVTNSTHNASRGLSIYGSLGISDDIRKTLAGGKARIKLNWEGVIWRCVDAQGRALPWVETALLTAEDAATAITLRKRWLSVRKGKQSKDAKYTPDFATELAEVRKITLERNAQEFLDRSGAWYDTEAKCQALGSGYSCLPQKLEPGKKYVLFLWSNSRDELHPDRRVDFTAKQSSADLGVIVLPTYKD